MTTTAADADGVRERDDDCMRCGYILVGVADDAPCPECGLLAGRSRRLTEALWDARPGWLRRITLGLWLVLLSIPLMILLSSLSEVVVNEMFRRTGWAAPSTFWIVVYLAVLNLPAAGAALFFTAGWWLLTTPEKGATLDPVQRRCRRMIRSAASTICIGVFTICALIVLSSVNRFSVRAVSTLPFDVEMLIMGLIVLVAIALLCLPVPGFLHLRWLAQRIGSAHLAEHCLIVGWGTTVALVAVIGVLLLANFHEELGLGQNWMGRSTVSLGLQATALTAGLLFVLWATYVWIRFAVAFWRAGRRMKRLLRDADLAQPAR